MFELVRKLNEECGVPLPKKGDQDWEFCAGDYTRTEDYIKFYKKYSYEMEAGKFSDKEQLSDMIIQGIEDLLMYSYDTEYADKLWSEFRQILISDELYRNIVYWSCIGQPIENCWNITPRMRDLLRELIQIGLDRLCQKPPYDKPVHDVSILSDTPLYGLLKKECISVNSYHHQGVRELSPKLKCMARSPDGLIEAVYSPEYKFLWAVQWHPEFSYEKDENSQLIFKEFVSCCSA